MFSLFPLDKCPCSVQESRVGMPGLLSLSCVVILTKTPGHQRVSGKVEQNTLVEALENRMIFCARTWVSLHENSAATADPPRLRAVMRMLSNV
jgi:hypothetical protein